MELTTSQFTLMISAIAFVIIFLLCLGVLQASRQSSRRKEIVDKIRLSGGSYAYDAPAQVAEAGFARFLRALGNRVMPPQSADYSAVRLKFLRAGIRRENVTAVFWGAKIFLAACLPLVFLAIRLTVLKISNPQVTLLITVFAALAGYYLPDFWLRVRTEQRMEKIQRALPDALDLMVVCVDAGMGMDGAINRVAKEIELGAPEISDEFALLNLELRAGKARQDALKNLALRTNIKEITSLVTLLVQTDKFGTSVAAALKVFADGFRSQRFQKAEELAAKLPVKILLPLLFFIFPALFVIIMGPAAIQIYKNVILGLGG